jgi:histone-lysine N-methyltransferase SETD2
LIDWARSVGKRNGFVIIIKKSDKGGEGKKSRLKLGCERGGQYHIPAIENETDKQKKKRRFTGTKKCGCPFLLKGIKLDGDDEWMLEVECGLHNHPAAENLEGHSYVGRLSREETSLLVDMSKSLVRPKEILHTIKQKDPLNKTTMKTIYNVRQRARLIEKAGRSQMQQLLGKLCEHNYIEWHRSCAITDRVKDLFFAHPISIEILRAFPQVLIMDCTYKTNRYRLPLLEIVGVTSTNLTFSVALAYLEGELEDNYIWALSRLKTVLEDGWVPNIIITDRELALMNAIERVFPTSKHMLCRWHINRNVLKKSKSSFDTKEKWDKFMVEWNMLVHSSTEDEYNARLSILETDSTCYPEVLAYVKSTWLNSYKERFVEAWTNNYMHFGNTTSNRYVIILCDLL